MDATEWERLYRKLQAAAEEVLRDDYRLHDVWCQPHWNLAAMLGSDFVEDLGAYAPSG